MILAQSSDIGAEHLLLPELPLQLIGAYLLSASCRILLPTRQSLQESVDLEEICWDISSPHDSIVQAPGVVLECAGNCIKPHIVYVATDNMTLSRDLVLVPSPLCQECCIMAILWV